MDPQKLTCDEARFFISRALDSDLDRVEIRQLFGHLGSCAECKVQLADLAVLESQISEINQLYEQHVLNESFDRKLEVEISRLNARSGAEQSRQSDRRLAAGPSQWTWWKPMAVTGFAGVFAGYLLFAVISPKYVEPVVMPEQRFFVHPMTYKSADDGRVWGDEILLPPGHTLRQVVTRGNDAPYHFRFQSKGTVNIVITHDDARVDKDPSYRLSDLRGFRYAALHRPREGDVIVVRNEGAEPVRVQTLAETAQALDPRLEKI